MTKTALLLEDDRDTLMALERWFHQKQIKTRLARSVEEARAELANGPVEMALLDVELPDGNGIDFAAELPAGTPVVFVTGYATIERAVRALRLKARDFLTKPLDFDHLEQLLLTTFPSEGGESERNRFGPFVGNSGPMRALYRVLGRVAATDATVFLSGETGVGKEVAARCIHALSERREAPFEAVNCGALSPSLIESELFGHERGSFTGAERQHQGVFERADGGTLLLDEVTEMPLELQVKLLRALETRTVARVGSSAMIEVDVRVIAASNRDPFQAVADGKLRQDLLYRLYVLPVEIPPLRQRGDDVVLLAQAFLDECNREEGTEKVLGASAVERLRSHDWPGNVRELKNVVRRAFLLANTSVEGHDIQHVSRQERDGDPYRIGIGMSLQEAERRLVLGTLRRCQGDKRETATRLGVSLKTIYNRLNAYAKQRDPLLPEDAIRGRQTG